MLRPLDPKILDYLARRENDDEGLEFRLHCHLETIREDMSEGQDWGHGVMCILHEGGDFLAYVKRTRPMRYEEMKGSNEWYIDFYESPLQGLSIKPNTGGIVDICAHGECIKSFKLIGCRENWVAMVKWIWEYGEKIAMMKSKRQAQKKSRKTGRRVEKPLLHKVLHPARFKALPENKTPAKDAAAASDNDNTDVIMNDVSTTTPPCNALSDTASTSTPDDRGTQNTTTEDVDISKLKVTDGGS